MNKYAGDDQAQKLSIRKSISIWVVGAVFSWVVVVVSLYNVIRFPDPDARPTIAQDEAERLNEVMPAAGPTGENDREERDQPKADGSN